jgi:site-specific DNA-methyltransferase (adenine-specific)
MTNTKGLIVKICEEKYKQLPDNIKALFVKLPNTGSDEVGGLFPDTQSGLLAQHHKVKGSGGASGFLGKSMKRDSFEKDYGGDSGSAARFFYCAKASKAERNAGCEGMPTVRKSHMQTQNGTGQRSMKEGFPDTLQQNHHPTVKPIALMSYLCRLITPPNGIILDPFMGSGSTGKACIREGFSFVGIDKDAESVVIAEKRVEYEQSKTHKIWTDLFE